MQIPLKAEDIKYFCCWPCSSGPVISTLTVPFGGYAPGQRIHYTLHIDNQSHGYDLEGIEIYLVQTYEFRATSPHYKSKTKKNTLSQEYMAEKVNRLSKRLINASLVIPAVPPSSRIQRIINVSYHIAMAIKTGGCHTDSEIEMPIIMGTIPLAQSAENPANAAQWIPQTPDTPAGAAADLPPSYDKCRKSILIILVTEESVVLISYVFFLKEPPSFEQATNIGEKFVDTDVNEHDRTDDFIPRYPMYTNFAVPSAPSAPSDIPEVPLLSLPHNPSAPYQNS